MPPKSPHYPLNDVRRALEKGNVAMRPSAERDSTNLEYYEEHVVACCLALTEENFIKTETYTHEERKTKCDVYLIDFRGPTESLDRLYVKFSFFGGWVALHSFHLQR